MQGVPSGLSSLITILLIHSLTGSQRAAWRSHSAVNKGDTSEMKSENKQANQDQGSVEPSVGQAARPHRCVDVVQETHRTCFSETSPPEEKPHSDSPFL